jgi:hypothetical protein
LTVVRSAVVSSHTHTHTHTHTYLSLCVLPSSLFFANYTKPGVNLKVANDMGSAVSVTAAVARLESRRTYLKKTAIARNRICITAFGFIAFSDLTMRLDMALKDNAVLICVHEEENEDQKRS